jgi:hypothetical protein
MNAGFIISASLAVLGFGVAPLAAKPAGCSLVIAEQQIFSGRCDFSSHHDGRGGFVLTSPSGHFVYVNIFDTPGEAHGYWNGPGKGGHAHHDLGTLIREESDPACWSNDQARVCAY